MSNTVGEPPEAPDDHSHRGFCCPGPFFLPGLLAILNIHLLAVLAGLYMTTQEGLSWSAVGLSAGTIVGFWVIFLLAAGVVGVRGAINLLGFAYAILLWVTVLVGVVGGLVWLVWGWLAGLP